MPQPRRPDAGQRMHRVDLNGGIRAAAGEARRVSMSFSSEAPYKRYWGVEILDHGENAVDLRRLAELGTALFNHNRDAVIGRIENVRLENGRGLCDIVFDEDEESEKVLRKVTGGSLRGVSVGYAVQVWETVKPGEKSTCGRYTGPCDIARKWEPLEVSIVSVPADASVGVGRSEDALDFLKEMVEMARENQTPEQEPMTPATPPAQAQREEPAQDTRTQAPTEQPPAREPDAQETRDAERQRAATILDICRQAGMDAAPFIRDGQSVDRVREAALLHLTQEQGGVRNGLRAEVTRDEGDKFRSSAPDAILLRADPSLARQPVEGARELAGLGLVRMTQRALEMDGIDTRHMGDTEIIERAFLQGDGSFAAIMDQTVGKTVEKAYTAVKTTYQHWAKIGSLPDFKRVPAYRLGEADSLVRIPMTGELPEGKFLSQNPYTRGLDTYGKKVGISRQMLINDSIGQFADLARGYAQTAARDVNRAVYKLLTLNPKLEIDGVELFHAKHGNIGTPAALDSKSLAEMFKLLALQRGLDKDTDLNLEPEYLLVPVELSVAAAQLLRSMTDPSQANPNVINPLQDRVQVIVDPFLDRWNPKGYYVVGDQYSVGCVGVDFFNGKNEITVRRGQPMGVLGMQWDIFLDYGVWAGDFRSLVRNDGA